MPTLEEFKSWRSTSEAARELGKSRQGILWMAKDGRLRGVETSVGWLFDPASLEAYKQQHNTKVKAKV